MADIAASNWTEADSSNTTAAPDGAPEGMAPSGVNNVLRAHQGAIKRFWNKLNAVKTTGGTSSAYTLTYDVAPAAYADGEIISFVMNAANAADATLDVNALGAVPLRLFGGNLLAGALLADQIVQARYNSSAGAFDILNQNGWVRLGEQDPSGASAVDFTGIPAGVKHLMAVYDLKVGTTGSTISLRTYGADGVLDSGASDYYWNTTTFNTANATSVTSLTTTKMDLSTSTVDSGDASFGGDFTMPNIQAATYTKVHFRNSYQNGGSGVNTVGNGTRTEAARITGVRFLTDTTFTGKITLFASA